MSEFEIPYYEVPLDAESEELRAWAAFRCNDLQDRRQNYDYNIEAETAVDHISHWYNRNYRQLGRAVDEATSLSGESTRRRLENAALMGLFAVGSAVTYVTTGTVLKDIKFPRIF